MIEIKNCSDAKVRQDLIRFCLRQRTDDLALSNLRSLPSLLCNRFSGNGEMFVAYENENVVGCSGVYLSDFEKRVALLGCRSWLTSSFRSKSIIRDQFLPLQKQWAIQRNAKQLVLSFNEYNKNLRLLFLRKLVARKARESESLFFQNISAPNFMVNIQSTPQWILIESLSDWRFDWEQLRVK